jgi:hypothetical protein
MATAEKACHKEVLEFSARFGQWEIFCLWSETSGRGTGVAREVGDANLVENRSDGAKSFDGKLLGSKGMFLKKVCSSQAEVYGR